MKSRVIVEESFFSFNFVDFVYRKRETSKYLSKIWEGRRGEGKKKVVVSQSLRQLIRCLFPRFSLFILLNATFCQAVAPIFPCFPASVNRDFASSTAFLGTHISSTIIATTDRWMGLQRGKRTSAEKRVASISVDGFVLSTCLVSILQLEIILLQRWSLLSSLIEIIISSFRISVPLSISHSSWKENEFYGFVCRSRSIFF